MNNLVNKKAHCGEPNGQGASGVSIEVDGVATLRINNGEVVTEA